MKIAFTTTGKEWTSAIDPRFGRTEYFMIFDDESKEKRVVDNTKNKMEAHGAGPKASQTLFDEKVNVLITGNGPGGNALSVLEKAKIDIYVGAGNMTVDEAYEAYKNAQLKKY